MSSYSIDCLKEFVFSKELDDLRTRKKESHLTPQGASIYEVEKYLEQSIKEIKEKYKD